MNRFSRKAVAFMLTAALVLATFTGCSENAESNTDKTSETGNSDEVSIVLSDNGITVDGEKIIHSATDSDTGSVHLSNDVIYYEDKDTYESGNPYGEGTDADKHSAAEAAATTVVNITKAGTYRLSGSLSQGQIRVDLGEDAFENSEAVVTLIMDGVDINCDVAPAVLFLNVYECDNQWSTDTASSSVDTSAAGANVIIADGSENNIEGSYVARIYKDNTEEKKLWKQDGAFYSYMSMNIDGESDNSGILNINADNEGLDSELHLTINGGNINIFSGNDGINTNEDGVSVTTINGGNIHIVAGLGEEGDGIDSNGWLVINGGTVVASANPAADAGMDSDMGSFVNGGTVVALGSTMDWAESDSQQVTMNLQFAEYKESDNAIIVTKEDGSVVFAYDPSEDEVVGSNIRQFMGAVISCPDFAVSDSYNVYIGGTVTGDEVSGIYNISTVTGFDDAVQQAYSGTDVMMGPGMGGFKGQMNQLDKGEFEKGQFDPNNLPEGGEFDPENMEPDIVDGERPEGMEPGKDFNGEMPVDEDGNPIGFGGEGERDFPNGEKPEGFDPQMGENVADGSSGTTVFYMQDKVNNFSGVSDYTV